ncbi:MAG: hypothetical protein PHT19_09290 [Methylococcus sp.]|nr:hypothetical protein [Methylococcus sp.]
MDRSEYGSESIVLHGKKNALVHQLLFHAVSEYEQKNAVAKTLDGRIGAKARMGRFLDDKPQQARQDVACPRFSDENFPGRGVHKLVWGIAS